MRYGVILPGGTAVEQLEQAVLAEEAGWDGVFVWEAAYGVDAWGLLSAMAARTERIKLGTMLTPLPWRRPWKVASQVVTLDQLSGGRAILAVGLGAVDTDLPLTGEELDLRTRASMMDEGIDLIRELWAGGLSYHGRHYDYVCARDDLTQVGRPVQERIPIWVVGAWPRPKSMRRVLRCDGVLPQYRGEAGTCRTTPPSGCNRSAPACRPVHPPDPQRTPYRSTTNWPRRPRRCATAHSKNVTRSPARHPHCQPMSWRSARGRNPSRPRPQQVVCG